MISRRNNSSLYSVVLLGCLTTNDFLRPLIHLDTHHRQYSFSEQMQNGQDMVPILRKIRF